jgi:MoxR-like ATPase
MDATQNIDVNQNKASYAAFVERFRNLKDMVSSVILGQEQVIEDVLIAALSKGHVLIEGAPGLGKTRLVRTFAEVTDLAFGRIQFTPDLMPADVTGTTVFLEDRGSDKATSRFEFQKGPIFCNVLLADEINRATPKTQSALLEAMQEYSVTASGTRYPLPQPFMVLATQNPLEMEGTYPLPEAQLDRFLFKILIERPNAATLERILYTTTTNSETKLEPMFKLNEMVTLQKLLRAVPIANSAISYIVRLTEATHSHPLVRLGASPRGAQAITLAAKGYALAAGRPNVELEDIRRAAYPSLRHRLLLSFEAEVEGARTDDVIKEVLNGVDHKK